MSDYSRCIIFVIAVLIYSNNAQTNVTINITSTAEPNIVSTLFITTPALTVSSIVIDVIEEATGNQIDLSNNVYTWNVTLIIQLINETDPTYLYESGNIELLIAVLPAYIIEQAPVDLLIYHKLCEYIDNTTIEYTECIEAPTLAPISFDFCVGPLIHTNLPNPLQSITMDEFNAHLSTFNLSSAFDILLESLTSTANLSYPLSNCGTEIYGISTEEQNVIDTFKVIGCTFSLCAILFLVINQYMDLKKSGTKFIDKPLLQIIPYINTGALFLITFLMTLSEITGKEAVVCKQHDYGDYDEEKLEFSFENPGNGQNGSCTVVGLIFYVSLLAFAFYTVLLCFLIFRQLYNPLNPFWRINQRWFHLGIVSILLIFAIIALSTNSISGIYATGLCIPGITDKYQLLGLINIPMVICVVIGLTFLILASVLLQKEITKRRKVINKNDKSTKKIQDLLKRLIFYSIGINAAGILLCVTVMRLYAAFDEMYDEYKRIIGCQLMNIFLEEFGLKPIDCKRKKYISDFWFISWIIITMLGVASQIMLSCHSEVRNRIKRVTVNTTIASKLKRVMTMDPDDDTTHTRSKNNLSKINIDSKTGSIKTLTDSKQAIPSDTNTIELAIKNDNDK